MAPSAACEPQATSWPSTLTTAAEALVQPGTRSLSKNLALAYEETVSVVRTTESGLYRSARVKGCGAEGVVGLIADTHQGEEACAARQLPRLLLN